MNILKHLLLSTGPIEAKFHEKPPWEEGTNFYSNSLGHMTNVAAKFIYSKNVYIKKTSSVERKSR